MADPLTPEQARARLRAVTRGQRPRVMAPLDVATAKARLRAADPGVDIGPTLRLLGQHRWRPALFTLLPWLLSDEGRSWLAPALVALAEGFLAGLAKGHTTTDGTGKRETA